MSGARVLKLFATPVIVDQLDDAAGLNPELEATILARMQADPGLRLSNQGGWQSRHDLPAWGGAAGKRVIAAATALATASTTDARGGSGVAWTVEAWANVSETGASNRAHVHGGSYWSAVYYVRVGDGEGGALVLHDPRMPALRMHAPNLRFKDCGSEVMAPIQPREGLLVLFPAWLSHSVEPWAGEGSRVSIAMNIRAMPVPGRRGVIRPPKSTDDEVS
jgi:uncharacterized protein (TIGR02466 family)